MVDAIRASCAFPGLFEPVEIGTRCLADGSLVAQVPRLPRASSEPRAFSLFPLASRTDAAAPPRTSSK